MNQPRISHRRVKTQPLTTVLLRAKRQELITDIQRLASVAGVDLVVSSLEDEVPPAVLTLVERTGHNLSVAASFNELFQPDFAGQEVIVNPTSQPGDLLELFVAAGATQRGQLIGVVGGHGGAGATILAAMLARTLTSQAPSVSLVDMDPLSPGYQYLLSLGQSGKRWIDIRQESGTLLPGRLLDALPSWKDVAVLTGDDRGSAQLAQSGFDTATSVAQASAVTVVDLPRSILTPGSAGHTWLGNLDHIIVVTRPGLVSLAHTRHTLSVLPHIPTTVVIGAVKTHGHGHDCATQLRVSDALTLRYERTLDGDIAHGMTPGDRMRSGSARDMKKIATRVYGS